MNIKKHLDTVLGEYAEYTSRVRAYTREMDLEEAVERAITECIKEGILKRFFGKKQSGGEEREYL